MEKTIRATRSVIAEEIICEFVEEEKEIAEIADKYSVNCALIEEIIRMELTNRIIPF